MKKSSIEEVEEKLPPGFRFYPRDEELICDYLISKVVMTSDSTCATTDTSCSALPVSVPQLVEVDLNKSEPWDIPETACVGGKEWYFYSRRDRKYATGLRTNRATATGYWKATGKDRAIYGSIKGTRLSLVGMRKTLVFYRGRAPKGNKSDWVMHEFRLEGSPLQSLKFSSLTKEDWVLCRVFHKDKDDESSGKQVPGSSRSDEDHVLHLAQLKTSTSSSSLMDDPYICFTQSHTNSNVMMNQNHHSSTNPTSSTNLQVPCFSIFSHNQTMSYYYPTMVAASVSAPEHANAPPPPFKTHASHSTSGEEYDGQRTNIKPDTNQQNFPLFNNNANLKVVAVNQLVTTTANSDDPASNKLKSKASSSDEFGDGNHCSDRDSAYPSESMWRHQRY